MLCRLSLSLQGLVTALDKLVDLFRTAVECELDRLLAEDAVFGIAVIAQERSVG